MKNKFKLKPTQAARGGGGGGGAGSRALANKRSFSLVFLLNTIDEEQVRETLKRNPKVENSLLHKAAKKGFKAGFNPIPQEDDELEEEDPKSAGEPADDGSSSSEEEDEEEEEDNEEEELISSAEEVYLDNIRNNLSLREQLRDIGGNVLTNWDHLEEPRDIDHLLSIISHIFDFTYEKEKTTEPTEYYSR